MQRWHALWLMVLARLKMFYREPEALFWVYFFPILMAVGLAVAFWNRPPEPPQVDVVRSSSSSESDELAAQLNANGVAATVQDEDAALRRYRVGKTALFVSIRGGEVTFGLDATRPESIAAKYHVEAVVRRWKTPDAVTTAERLETEPGNRYIDFLLPGLMGMNILGGGMWGIGFVIVDLRVRKFLKRLIATPMRRSDFLASLLIARLIMLVPEMLSLYLVGRLAFGVPMRGSVITMGVIMVLGALASCGHGPTRRQPNGEGRDGRRIH